MAGRGAARCSGHRSSETPQGQNKALSVFIGGVEWQRCSFRSVGDLEHFSRCRLKGPAVAVDCKKVVFRVNGPPPLWKSLVHLGVMDCVSWGWIALPFPRSLTPSQPPTPCFNTAVMGWSLPQHFLLVWHISPCLQMP